MHEYLSIIPEYENAEVRRRLAVDRGGVFDGVHFDTTQNAVSGFCLVTLIKQLAQIGILFLFVDINKTMEFCFLHTSHILTPHYC